MRQSEGQAHGSPTAQAFAFGSGGTKSNSEMVWMLSSQ